MGIFLCLSGILSFLGVLVISKKKISQQTALKIFTCAAFIGLVIFSGCRALDVGNDTPMYVRYFNSVDGLHDISKYQNRFEFLFRVFVCAIAQFFDSPHALLFISSLVIIFISFRVIYKNSVTPWYSVLMYIFLMFYYNSMCLMRQYIAVALCMVALSYLAEHKWIKFIIFVVAAGLFHTSALIVLIMLPLMSLPFNKEKKWWYVVGAVGAALCIDKLIGFLVRLFPRYAHYLNSEDYYLQNQIGTVIKIIVWALLFFVVDYVYDRYSDGTYGEKLEYFAELLGFSISLASLQGAILSRISTYFVIMFCISIANALDKLPVRKTKYQLATLIMAGCFAYNMLIFVFRPYWSGVLPYTFWK